MFNQKPTNIQSPSGFIHFLVICHLFHCSAFNSGCRCPCSPVDARLWGRRAAGRRNEASPRHGHVQLWRRKLPVLRRRQWSLGGPSRSGNTDEDEVGWGPGAETVHQRLPGERVHGLVEKVLGLSKKEALTCQYVWPQTISVFLSPSLPEIIEVAAVKTSTVQTVPYVRWCWWSIKSLHGFSFQLDLTCTCLKRTPRLRQTSFWRAWPQVSKQQTPSCRWNGTAAF